MKFSKFYFARVKKCLPRRSRIQGPPEIYPPLPLHKPTKNFSKSKTINTGAQWGFAGGSFRRFTAHGYVAGVSPGSGNVGGWRPLPSLTFFYWGRAKGLFLSGSFFKPGIFVRATGLNPRSENDRRKTANFEAGNADGQERVD